MDDFKLVQAHGETPQQFLERAVRTAYDADFELRETQKQLRQAIEKIGKLEKKNKTMIRKHKADSKRIKFLEAAELRRQLPEKSSRQKCNEKNVKREY